MEFTPGARFTGSPSLLVEYAQHQRQGTSGPQLADCSAHGLRLLLAWHRSVRWRRPHRASAAVASAKWTFGCGDDCHAYGSTM